MEYGRKILVWNGTWKEILVWNGIWNGRFLEWNGNGMEENCQYGIWKNRLPFHTMPCRPPHVKTARSNSFAKCS